MIYLFYFTSRRQSKQSRLVGCSGSRKLRWKFKVLKITEFAEALDREPQSLPFCGFREANHRLDIAAHFQETLLVPFIFNPSASSF
jgi:hypothetical protein